MLDWQDIPLFLALARGGTLSAAARVLRVKHATVSRRVAALEEAPGAPLFERTPAGFSLTAAGRGVLTRAEAIEAAAAAMPEAVGPDGDVAGLVRVTLTRVLADGFVARRLVPLLAAHPGAGGRAGRRIAHAEPGARREADFALRLARPRRGPLLARRAATLAYGFFATADWRDRLAAGAAPVFIGFDAESLVVPEAACARQALPGARVALRSNSQGAQAAARGGAGIALLHGIVAGEVPDLAAIGGLPPPPPRELWPVMRSERSRQPPGPARRGPPDRAVPGMGAAARRPSRWPARAEPAGQRFFRLRRALQRLFAGAICAVSARAPIV